MVGSTRARYFRLLFAVSLLFALMTPLSAAAQEPVDWAFRVETPHDIWSEGGSWAIGTDILVLVNDDVSGSEFAATTIVEQAGPNPEDVGWWLNTGDFEIEPGDVVTVDDGVDIKYLDVLDLAIDTVDMTTDAISGTAPANTTFPVHATDGVDNGNVDATSDAGGAWTADFSGLFDIRPGTGGSAAIFDDENDATQRSWSIEMPTIESQPQNDIVQGQQLAIGVDVLVEIDDPANGVGVDWSDSGTTVPTPWDPSVGYVEFDPGAGGFDVAAGQQVTLTDPQTTKVLIVAPLAITDVDIDGDVVHGTASGDAELNVWADSPGSSNRGVTAAPDGSWIADFSVAWEGWDPFDITFGSHIDVWEGDDDGDTTRAFAYVPNPQFSVETPNQVWSHGDGWIAGRTVTITVNDGVADLYSTTAPVEAWGPEPWEVGWNTGTGGFEILPGHAVTVDDGVDIVRVLDVVALDVTGVDEANDTISGFAPPDAWVDGHADDGLSDANRRVQADASGNFTIDFGTPGVEDWEQDTIDLRAGVGGAVQVFDGDGDSTHHGWGVADPRFGVDVIHEEMWAADWPVGATLDFQVFEPDDLVNPVWDDSMAVVETSSGQTEAGYRFWGDFDVHGGHVITVTDGSLTRELVVSTLEVTNVDPDTETYTGTVDASVEYDRTHEVCAWARHLTDDQQGVELCTIPDATGDWVIDFTGVGRLVPGDHTGAYQSDPDGDQTSYAWFVPPWIYVEIGDDANPDFPDRVHLDQWAFPVNLTNGTDSVVVTDTDGDGWEVVAFDVTPGDTITATGDDGRVKSLYLEELSVDTVTLWNEDPPSTVYGSTTVSYGGNVQVTASADYGWWTERWVDAAGGAYEADFANPGNGWREQELGYFGQGGADDVFSGGEIRAHIWDADNDQVQAIWHATNPRIIIVRGNDRIEAIDFPLGEPLTIEVDDPAFDGIEFSETGIVGTNPAKPWETLLVFDLGDYTVPDVATVTARDEAGTPLVTTEVIPFSIDLVDPENDTISGTAAEGSEVLVQADGNWRYPIADATDTWLADFSQPGTRPGEENPVDIGPGSNGGATLIAQGGSATTVLWSLSNATFGVDPVQNNMWGGEFMPNGSVTITVDSAGQGDFGTDGAGQFNADWDPAALDLVAGMEIEVDDGDVVKTHTITTLAVTGVDEAADSVSGNADPGSDVDVWVHESDAWRHVVADGMTGAWTADFGVPGEEPGEEATADLVPGTNGNSSQCDDDGDCTYGGWSLPNAIFRADPRSGGIWGHEWFDAVEVTITIDGEEVATVPVDGNGDWGTGVDPGELTPGALIEVTGGEVTKSLVMTALMVTLVDEAEDAVHGTADGSSEVQVEIHDVEEGIWRHVVADSSTGEWVADFTDPISSEVGAGSMDFEPGVYGAAYQVDDDGDTVWIDWSVAFARIGVEPRSESLWGNEWAPNSSVTITINGEAHSTLPTDEWGDFGEGWDPGELDLQSGDEIIVTDGATTKTHIVTPLAIVDIDVINDTMAGTATPDGAFSIWVHDSDAYRWVEVDVLGDWTVDWTGDADLVPGSNGNSYECDDDGDCTWAGWEVPNPSFSVETPFSVWSHGEGWVEGRTVTLMVDDNDDPTDGILSNDSTLVERWGPEPWEVGWSFEIADGFEVEPGHFVSVYDGVEIEKTLWVEELEIVDIDEDADTITGIAPAMARILLNAGNDEYQVYRTVEADVNGDWFVDFSVPGDAEGEQDVFDIEVDTGGSAEIPDEDGDSTHRGWYVEEPPTPNFFVRPDGDELWGSEWFGGPEVTVTIYDAFGTLAHEATFPTEDGEFYEELDFNVVPLDYIVVTDGESTKDHVVTELTVTDVDLDADMVHGIATPGAEVFVGSSLPATIWEHLNFQFGPENRNPDSLNENLKFRQAVAHAIDRGLIAAQVPGVGYVIDSYVDAFIPELSQHAWDQYPYDPAAAAALIDGLCTDLGRDCVANPPVAVFTTTAGNEARETLADLLVPMLADAGIELQLELDDPGAFFDATLPLGTFDIGGWAFLGVDSLAWLSGTHHSFDPEERFEQNVNNWGTPDSSVIDAATIRMAELIGLMEGTGDVALLEGYIAEAEQILADEVVIIPLYVQEGGFEIEGPYRLVTADDDGNWTADFAVAWEDQETLDIELGTGGYAEETDDDGDATHAGWQATASSATVEGHVYLDGAPLPDVEVWTSSDEVFTCTDADGYFVFEGLSPVGDVLVATGPSYSEAGCGNTAFVDPDGMPLLVAAQGELDLTDGYEYLEFNVEYAAAIQYVRVEDITGGGATPVNDVVIHAFDRNDEEFIDVFGHDPDPADYQAILDTGIGEIEWIDWTGAAVDHEDGLAEVRYAAITDVLVLAELDPIQGAQSSADEFAENNDGIVEGPEILFQIGDAGPVVTVDDMELYEGNRSSRVLVTFRLSEPVDSAVTVEWTTADGSAVAGEDYVATSGTVTFRGGRTEVFRRVQILGDTELELDEFFEVVLLSADGAAVGDPATVTLLNDDDEAPDLPELSVGDVEVTEGDGRNTRVAIPITLSSPATSTITFTLATVAGTASAGADFVDLSRTVPIRSGSTSASVYVVVFADTLPEGDEWFTVEVSNLVGATLADGIGEVVIIDDD